MNNGPGDAEVVIMIVVMAVVMLVALAVALIPLFFLYKGAAGVPEQFRLTQPGLAFLMLIPCFSLVWIFIFTKNVSQGYQNTLRAAGQYTDDCGEQMGMWWGICSCCSVIPYIGIIPGLAGLALMIVYLVKLFECKRRVESLGMVPNYGGGQAVQGYQSMDNSNPYRS
ncbi:MAG: hypothetical protein KDA85_19385 [Planctomycetaceae bacterium]|nr:hypothetical protein [Planctomycetaceae bacterium]MCA9060688.1 hypothetical protein [Planctomycetaceae bacterium]